MSEWKKYPETKPEKDINCVVKNIRRPFDSFLAIYSTYDDAFWQYEPNQLNKPYIAVTHYIEIPALPLEEWK